MWMKIAAYSCIVIGLIFFAFPVACLGSVVFTGEVFQPDGVHRGVLALFLAGIFGAAGLRLLISDD